MSAGGGQFPLKPNQGFHIACRKKLEIFNIRYPISLEAPVAFLKPQGSPVAWLLTSLEQSAVGLFYN